MPRDKRSEERSPAPQIGQTQPKPEEGAPSAELTNYSHPGREGRRRAVPGAGIVSSGADAGPIESGPPELVDAPHPGRGRGKAPASAPGAMRPEAFSPPSGPDDTGMPEGADETLSPEIHDPNFSAAKPGPERRASGKKSKGKTR